MKSLKERLAEKAARQAKEDAKLSGKVKCYRFSLPFNGYPYVSKESDVKYVKDRAFALVKKIRSFSAHQLYEGLKEAVNAEEKRIADARTGRSWWEPQANINSGISKYIVVVQKEDGTLKGDDGTIYVKQTPERKPETPAPTAEQLAARVNELDRRTRELQDETPRSVEHAQRLLEDAGNLEVDLQEVLRELESDNDADSLTPEEQAYDDLQTFDNPTSPPVVERSDNSLLSPAVNELLNNLPTSGEALSHTVQNNITPTWVLRHREIEAGNLTPEQEDAIVQPSIEHILPIPPVPLPEGLTIPMDYIYSISSEPRPAAVRLRGPLSRSARRRRGIVNPTHDDL
jgi:hypothetical protein